MGVQAVSVSIGGTTKAVKQLRWSSVINGIGRASFTVDDPSGTYVPADDDPVVISLGGSPVWGGEVSDVDVTYLGHSGVSCVVTCHDYNQLAQRGLINTIYQSQSLKTTLESLVDAGGALGVNGITLAAGQATGPTLGVITAPWWTAQQLLDHLTTLTGYVWRINANKVLEMWDVGVKSSGVTLSLANGNVLDARWRRERYDYRNRQWVVFGPTEVQWVDDLFDGDGSTRQFVLRYTVASAPGSVTIDPGGTVAPVGTYGVDTMEWTYDAATLSIRQDASYTVLSGSQTLTVHYQSQFPNYAFDQDAGEVASRGEWNAVVSAPDILTYDEAVAYAAALIRESLPRPQMPRVSTRTDGVDPGETVVIDLADVGLSSVTALVQQVDVDIVKAEHQADPYYTLSCFAGSESVPTAVALWRRLLTGSSVAGGLATGGGGGGGVTTIVNGVIEGDLGGSRLNGVTHSTWAPVREHREWVCPADGTYTAYVEAWTSSAGTSCTPRVYDITDAAAAVTGSATTSTTPAKQALVFSAVAGRSYRLEVLPGNTSADVFGLGKVRT